MRRALLLMVLGAGACNAVFGLEPIGGGGVDGAVDAVPIDAEVDARPCVEDEFDGDMLNAHWTVGVGAMPTLSDVSGSRLLIADAPFAPTPSMPNVSWLYDLDRDRANQLWWDQPIGDGDFRLDADVAWSSTNAELTIGGVGVVSADGLIAAYAGVQDGNGAAFGHVLAQVRGEPTDPRFAGGPEEPGTTQIHIERTAGMATVSLGGVNLITAPMPWEIAAVTIVYVRYRFDTVASPFGSIEVRGLRVCR